MQPIQGFSEQELAKIDSAVADVEACAETLRNMATKPRAITVESALDCANKELYRAINDNRVAYKAGDSCMFIDRLAAQHGEGE